LKEIVGHWQKWGDGKDPGVHLGEERTKAIAEITEASVVNVPEEEQEQEQNIDDLERSGLPEVDYPDPGDDDYVSLFAKALVSGTNVSVAYVREPLKYLVNHVLDGHFFHPAYLNLSLRGNHFSIGESETAKTYGFDLAKKWMEPQFKERGFLIRKLLSYKSEALLVKSLSTQSDKKGHTGNPNQFLYLTEGAELAAKKNNDCFQEVFAKLMDLYDQTEADTGSFTNGQWHAEGVKVSTFMCFTPNCFRDTFGAKGSVGSGGLGRYTSSAPRFVFRKDDWTQIPDRELEKLFLPLMNRLPDRSTAVFLEETPEAKEIRLEAREYFSKAGRLGKRILEGFVKEQVNRGVMSKDHPNIMTGKDAERIFEWAKSVVEARSKTWPADAGNSVEQMEYAIRRLIFDKKHRVSEALLKDAAHYYRLGSGGAWTFHSALKNLKNSDIKWSGVTRKGTHLYCPKACRKHPNLDDLTKPELKEFMKSVG